MKKILSFILVLLIALSFAACGNQKTENSVNDNVEIQEEEKAPVAENETENDIEMPQEEKEEEDEKEVEKAPEKESQEKPEKEPEKSPEKEPEVEPETKPEEKPEEPKEEAPDNQSKSLGNTLLSEFKAAAGAGSAISVAEKLSQSAAVSAISPAAMSVEPGFLNGFDNAEITGFKEGAMFAPMIGTIPFVGYVFTLEDGVDAASFISNLKASANLRWNICTAADEMVSGSSGNKVFFVMCPAALEN